MTAEEIARVRATWALALASGDDLAERFYARLFEQAPHLRPLFRNADPAAQADKLAQTLALAIQGLDDLPALAADLAAMGRRHAGYGVEPVHYAAVGDALVFTVAQVVGPAFGHRDREAWATIYAKLVAAMIGDGVAAGTSKGAP